MIMYMYYRDNVEVYLDTKHVGVIKKEEGGYRYYPDKSKRGGELFATLQGVKNSLESDD